MAYFAKVFKKDVPVAIDIAYMAVAFPTANWTSEYAFLLMLIQLLLGNYDLASGMGASQALNLCQDVAVSIRLIPTTRIRAYLAL